MLNWSLWKICIFKVIYLIFPLFFFPTIKENIERRSKNEIRCRKDEAYKIQSVNKNDNIKPENNKNENVKKTDKNSSTGDSTPIILLMILMCISLSAIVVIRRRKSN